jgi:hypothetical protein
MRWKGHVLCKTRSASTYIIGKPDGKKLLGRLKHRWINESKDVKICGVRIATKLTLPDLELLDRYL